ncbi:MAG TPA: T9SS type A sorting domain-containing protein [Bacteroidota bacterium]|jgi:hypothetical protein
MRFFTAFLCVVLFSCFSLAQKKYLVSPNQEVIPIPRGSSAQKLIEKYNKERAAQSVLDNCSGGAQFGFDPLHFPIDSRFGFSHKDVMGEWFVAPARGTVDTFFFQQPAGSTISALDSQVIVRIFKSNISPGHGPGYDYPRPCRSWGYWLSTADLENGVAPFIEDATDTNWHSTIETNGGTIPSFEPFGLSVWGLSGVPVKIVSQGVTEVPMDIIPGGFQIKHHSAGVKDTIDIGETFFFSLKMNSQAAPQAYPDPAPTQFGANGNNPPYPPFPARNWKFYEHDSGPSNCAGTPASAIKKGWVARGPLVDDTTAGAVYDVWYIMTPTTNVPPKINSVDGPVNTISTNSQTITAEIFDCDAEQPTHAGIQTASMQYTVTDLAGNTLSSGSASLDNIGGDTFLGSLPGTNAKNRIVRYKVYAYDSTGLADSSSDFRYKVVDFNSTYYRADTTVACTPMSIVGTGTVIDTSKWFLPPGTTNTHPGDDGTAGPYSLGGSFIYFGDTLNYAWVGVNGAIALSKGVTDTLDVNSNGFATDGFDLPQRQHQGRPDTTRRAAGFMPKNMIAPFWADWISKQDSPIATFGHVRTSTTAFPGKFIAEWDSSGDFDATGAIADNDVFRVVLDRAAGTIQFQYTSIGIGGLDTLNLTGLNSDSLKHPPGPIAPFNYFNKDGFPAQSHLHAGLCVTYYPVLYTVAGTDGWNLVSVGQTPPSHAKSFLYPTAVSPSAFAYHGSYQSTQTLANGPGFWLKFSGSQTLDAPGSHLTSVDDALDANWNMVGSVSSPVLVSSLTTTPPGIITSPFFGFSGSYTVATTIAPGKGYWVKTSAPGTLHIVGTGAVPKQAPGIEELAALDKVTIQDKMGRAQTLYVGSDGVLSAAAAGKYEMPPSAPEGALNVRFSSGRMVEVYPAQADPSKTYEYPISMQGAVYPLIVRWEAARGGTQKLALMAVAAKDSKMLGVIDGSGKVTITDANVTKLVLKLTEGLSVPKVFALSQNYPNPFNPTTHFSVDIPRAAVVDITVYDVLGRKITTLMSGEQEAGYHVMEWDSKDGHGLNVPSGMYMVRMTAGDFSAVRKIMLMK